MLTWGAGVPEAQAAGPEFGQVQVLKDRRAGAYEDVRKQSREVSSIRGGAELPLVPGETLHEQDAVRTAEGTCVLVRSTGTRIEVAERSQLRLDKDGASQRLGQVVYSVQEPFTVQLDAVTAVSSSGTFRITRDIPGSGSVEVLEGTLELSAPGGAVQLSGGQAVAFSQEAAETPGPLDSVTTEALQAWRVPRFQPAAVRQTSRRDRAHIRLAGGLSWLDGFASWGQVGLETRVRLAGPVWLSIGAGALGRPVDEVSEVDSAWALPTHVGARFSADLPLSLFLTGGLDFQAVVGARCSDSLDCSRVLAVQPGGRLLAGIGGFLSRRVGVDLEFSGGILRRLLPPVEAGLDPTPVIDGQFHLSLGIFVRL